MTKITTLTEYQWDQIYKARADWLRVGRSTEPCDRETTERCITALYARLNKPKPAFLWWQSPWQACVGTPLLLGALQKKASGQIDSGQLHGQLAEQLDEQLSGQLYGQLDGQLSGQLSGQLYGQLSGQLYGQLDGQLSGQLSGQLYGQLDGLAYKAFCARWSAWWCAWYAHCDAVLRVIGQQATDPEHLQIWIDLMRSGHMWFVFEGFVACSERPTKVSVTEDGRMHNMTGPALSYADGYALHAVQGTVVPSEWIESKDKLDPVTALNWENIEQRRAAAEIIGWDKIIAALNPVVINKDKDPQIGTLLRCDLPDSPGEQFLRVECGTGRVFALPVPPEMKTARAANAWTFGLEPTELNLEVRT